MEVPGLLDDPRSGVEHGGLALDLGPDRPLHRAQRVDVLGLGPGSPAAGPARRQRGVHVAAQRAFLHPDVGDTQRADQVAQLGDVGPGHLGRGRAGPVDRLGHDLDQRDTRPVVVDQRVVGAVDPAGGPAHVQRLAGVLLQVHALDADPDDPVRDGHVQPAVRAQRLVVLGDLEVLRHVRVEVVLPREPAPGRDPAVQGQADPDRVLDRQPVDHRQRAGQAQADRAHLAVRRRAEHGRAAAEHLGPGAQLDVRLQADHRLVALQRRRERDQRVRARGHESSPLAWVSSGWPQWPTSAASAAAATR